MTGSIDTVASGGDPVRFSLSVKEAWAAYRADPQWKKKTALGGLAYLIPVVGPFAVMSWQVGYIRDVAWGRDRPLPPVGDMETLAKRALYIFGGTLLWALPLYAIIFFLISMAMIGGGIGIGAAAAAGGLLAIPLGVCCGLIWVLVIAAVSLAYALLIEAALVRFALYERFDAFWEIQQIVATLREGRWKPLLWAMVRIWLIAAGIVLAMELVFMVLALGMGAAGVALFMPAALAPSGGGAQEAASIAAVGGVFLLQMVVWILELVLMVGMFIAMFPIVTIASHVYGQWGRHVYGIDPDAVATTPAPTEAAPAG